MAVQVSVERARLLRLRAHSLDNDEPEWTVPGVVRRSCGLQAQDARQAPLAIRARSRTVTAADVERARVDDRSIARTWCMRGTLHYVATTDLPWLTSLFGPLYVDRGARRLAELGFDETIAERAVAVVEGALAANGPLTREELGERLLGAGFSFDPDGQATVHVVRRACLDGVAVEAGRETYALLDDWVSLDPTPPDREDALAELARRYVRANEPATLDDFHAWSGLYKRDVRAGWDAIADELTAVDVDDERAWIVSPPDVLDREPPAEPTVRLLPMYDSYFLGHRDRGLVLPTAYAERVYPGGGVIRASVVADGRAVGTWRLDRSRAEPVVRVTPFDRFDPAVEDGVEAEVADVGRFLGIEPTLVIEP